MSVRIELRHGDLFDEVADLIVIPWSGVTASNFVRESLEELSIALPSTPMKLGQLRVREFREAQHLAHFVAFAATVGRAGSGQDERVRAIETIARKLGRYTRRNNALKIVSTALLGAGYGGLLERTVLEQLRAGFLAHGADDARLVVSALDPIDYRDLKAEFGLSRAAAKAAAADQNPRVFISYSWSSTTHKRWVERLAKYLCREGIQCRLDRFHYSGKGNVTQWMCNEVDLADVVLLICDGPYAKRSNGQFGAVGWETRIVKADLFSGANPTRYVPVVRTDVSGEGRLEFVKPFRPLHWPESADEEACRKKLVRRIRGIELQPRKRKPRVVVGYRERPA